VAGLCEHGNEPLGFIKFGEFLTNRGKICFSRRTLIHVVVVVVVVVVVKYPEYCFVLLTHLNNVKFFTKTIYSHRL
jgi:hypothetical protein